MVSNPFEHPSLRLRVTEEQRDRALGYLQEAYADGRLDDAEFERRMAKALGAGTRKELNAAFTGLAHIPISSGAVRPARQRTASTLQDVGAALVHWSPLVSWIVGPAVVYGTAERGTRMRAEAARALNFQILMTLVIASGFFFVNNLTWLAVVWWITSGLAWLIGTIVGGARVATGKPAGYPLGRLGIVPTGERKQLPRR